MTPKGIIRTARDGVFGNRISSSRLADVGVQASPVCRDNGRFSKDELSQQELYGISGGFCGFSLPVGEAKSTAFEIKDFSFGVENPT